jgi:hypothetical protein
MVGDRGELRGRLVDVVGELYRAGRTRGLRIAAALVR